MKFLIIICGVVIGIVISFLIIFLIVKKWLTNIVGESGMSDFKNALADAVESEKEAYTRPKSLAGMTSIVLPRIQRDMPDFNVQLLYSKVESGIKKILTYKSNEDSLSAEKDHELIYVSNSLKAEIENMKANNQFEHYRDIQINQTVIKEYKRINGAATIILESSVQYKYETNKKGMKVYTDINKQTRYITEFVYVYDENEFDRGVYNFAVNCPNCGAPAKRLGGSNCDYCGTYVEPINLKNWFISSYKEK
jgi:hypothetical protein